MEPAYAQALDWLLCDALTHVAGQREETTPELRPTELAFYFRLTTRPIDQTPFAQARERLGEALLRSQVIAGAYRLVDGRADFNEKELPNAPVVHLVGTGAIMPEVLIAAAELAKEGIECEIIDPRTLQPLDTDLIVDSAKKTNRVVVVHEAVRFGGLGGEIASQIQELAFDYLDAPVTRIGAPFSPVPFSPALEQHYIPDAKTILTGVREIMQRNVIRG